MTTKQECIATGHREGAVAVRDRRNREVGYAFCELCRVYTAIKPTGEAALEALAHGRVAYTAQPALFEEVSWPAAV